MVAHDPPSGIEQVRRDVVRFHVRPKMPIGPEGSLAPAGSDKHGSTADVLRRDHVPSADIADEVALVERQPEVVARPLEQSGAGLPTGATIGRATTSVPTALRSDPRGSVVDRANFAARKARLFTRVRRRQVINPRCWLRKRSFI